MLNLETWDRKTKVTWPKSGQPLRNSHCLRTYTPTQVTFLFYSSMNHVNSGKIWNQNNFIRLSCDQQIGLKYPLSTSPPSRPFKTMNQVILLIPGNPLQNTPKQSNRKIAQLLHAQFLWSSTRSRFSTRCSLPTSSQQRRWLEKFCHGQLTSDLEDI